MASVSAYHLLGVFLYGYFNYLINTGIYDNNTSATHEMFVCMTFYGSRLVYRYSRHGIVAVTNEIFELNGGFLFALLRIFMIAKIKVRKSAHLQFDIIAYLTTKRAIYKYNRRF